MPAYILSNDLAVFVQENDSGIDFTLYDANGSELDGGQIDDTNLSFDDAFMEITKMFHGLSSDSLTTKMDDEEFEEYLEAKETLV